MKTILSDDTIRTNILVFNIARVYLSFHMHNNVYAQGSRLIQTCHNGQFLLKGCEHERIWPLWFLIEINMTETDYD